jgi:type VI secretion system protein VasD
METTRAGPRLPFLVLLALLAAGCASKPPKVPPQIVALSVVASADVNPDASGRPSPVVLRFYQLKVDSAFANADFFALFDDDKRALAGDGVGREEIELAPGESRTLDLTLAPETRFVGALAAYRDLREATWRSVAPLTRDPSGRVSVKVTAQRAGVSLRVTP